jgi:hypothetical protein
MLGTRQAFFLFARYPLAQTTVQHEVSATQHPDVRSILLFLLFPHSLLFLLATTIPSPPTSLPAGVQHPRQTFWIRNRERGNIL